MPSLRFVPPPTGLTVFCAAVAAACLALSYWQHERAQLKEGLQQAAGQRSALPIARLSDLAHLGADDMLWRRATAAGSYDPQGGFLVDNRLHERRPGFHVVSPLDLGDTWLLVNRGWMPAPPVRADAVVPAPPVGRVTVSGLLAPDSGEAFELGTPARQGPIRQNLKIGDWQEETGRDAMPVVMLADSSSTDLVPVAATPDYGADRSKGYRFQWLALALVAVLGWLALALGRGKAR